MIPAKPFSFVNPPSSRTPPHIVFNRLKDPEKTVKQSGIVSEAEPF